MNTKSALLCLSLLASVFHAPAQGTTFTYQGRLGDGGNPANGLYDIRASAWDSLSGGAMLSAFFTNPAVAVSNGLFTIVIDLGPGIFTAGSTWLQVGVRTNGAAVDFAALSPRQQLTPTPYAIFAEGANAAGLSGTIPPGSLGGTYGSVVTFTNPGDSFTGNGAGLADVNAATLGGLLPSNLWQTSGNATSVGQLLGTINNQPLDLYANNVRALRLILRTDASGVYSNAPNVIGGSAINLVRTGVVGGTVGGGGGSDTNGLSYPNEVNANFGTVSGGLSNNITSTGLYAFIGGGQGNTANQGYGTIGGGRENTVNNAFTTVGGGFQNAASGPEAVVAGGYGNSASGFQAVIGGGQNNVASGVNAAIGGGMSNSVSGIGSFIGGGGFDGLYYQGNAIEGSAAVIVGGLSNNIPGGGSYSFIGGGYFNAATANTAVVGGGGYNTAGGNFSTIAGGFNNVATGTGSFIGGGGFDGGMSGENLASGGGSVVGGGLLNTTAGNDSAIGGGVFNYVSGIGSFIGGGGNDGTTVGGNTVIANAATIGGGLNNQIPTGARYAFIGGGLSNSARGYYSTVGGGSNNVASGTGAFVGGGGNDGNPGTFEQGNTASGGGAVVAGGVGNTASGTDSAVLGGYQNTASGFDAMVAGGEGNTAGGSRSFAAGTSAKATHDGSFVWADLNFFNFSDNAANVFFARCTGGVKFVTAIDALGSETAGVKVGAGGTSWSAVCDRNAKKNFQQVDTLAVLDKLAAIPIEQWNYKWEGNNDTPNLGPMAQDFKAAFYPGRDDKSISTLEFDGVELAAIQGLHKKLKAKEEEFNERLKAKEERLQQLERKVATLETLVSRLTERTEAGE